jgi:hypothetical protein
MIRYILCNYKHILYELFVCMCVHMRVRACVYVCVCVHNTYICRDISIIFYPDGIVKYDRFSTPQIDKTASKRLFIRPHNEKISR